MFIYHVILGVQIHQYNVLIYQLIYKRYSHLLNIRFAIVSYMYQNHAVLQCYIVCQYIKHVQNKAIIIPDTLDDIDLGVWLEIIALWRQAPRRPKLRVTSPRPWLTWPQGPWRSPTTVPMSPYSPWRSLIQTGTLRVCTNRTKPLNTASFSNTRSYLKLCCSRKNLKENKNITY